MLTQNLTLPLISIITPAYNAEKFIPEMIASVLNQSYNNWELIIINDGSEDNTLSIIDQFKNPRIQVFNQKNKGVSSARNVGLANMNGEYFCFLDADDILTTNSLESRIEVFSKYPSANFVDGSVQYVDEQLKYLPKKYHPSFIGKPYSQLLKMSSSCFHGPSWMIKRELNTRYTFETDLHHAEDLYFYLSISKCKNYYYTDQTILFYRKTEKSAMSNIRGLEKGYILLIKKIRLNLQTHFWVIFNLKLIIAKIMFLSFLFDAKKVIPALISPFKILKA